ncbi:MAG: hypothetical protein CMC82_01680 [Flavobacteriaceae bacterium]|nr:hypothetical protein [Flavobacteriaceae bacterium]|tara:strand:+ start:989 stop:1306 length:318 start_codon:yes stop_codon:yes gene_type:complete
MTSDETPQRKCTVEAKCLLHRWNSESKLTPEQMIESVYEVLDVVSDKFKLEVESLFHRWRKESDLHPTQIVESINDAIEEYYELEDEEDDESVGFDPDDTEDGLR